MSVQKGILKVVSTIESGAFSSGSPGFSETQPPSSPPTVGWLGWGCPHVDVPAGQNFTKF